MPNLRLRDGSELCELTKCETRRILEAVAILKQVERLMPKDGDAVDARIAAAATAARYGQKYIDDDGQLIIGQAEANVNEGAKQ
jgi:hypothetical protein